MAQASSEQFRFTRVQPGSETAAILGLAPTDPIWVRCNIWVCRGWDCPDCGRRSIYFQPVAKALDLFDPGNSAMLDYITGRAMAHDYHCPNCDTSWVNLAMWYRALELGVSVKTHLRA
jgi:predicted RNA-binding Zn-ribbon protein involved in translation (DUF1610 family)